MSLEKDIAMMVMLKKIKEMNMVNVVQNQDSFYQTLNMKLEEWQEKLQHHIGTQYVSNFISSIPVTDYVYAYLDKNQELVISSTDLYPKKSDLYDRKSNFGKCELQKEDVQEWYEKCKYIRTVRFEEMVKPITCAYWFAGCENLTEIKNMKNLDTSECVNMRDMFSCCSKLTTLDVSNFDVSNVKEMLYMFCNCNSLKFLDVSNWNTENVQDMFCMFQNCKYLHTDCSSLNIQNVKGHKIFANSTNIREPIWND